MSVKTSPTKKASETYLSIGRPSAVGQLASDWKGELKATLLLGSKEFVEQMKKLLRGDRREQTGLRKASQGTLSWEEITLATSELWGYHPEGIYKFKADLKGDAVEELTSLGS